MKPEERAEAIYDWVVAEEVEGNPPSAEGFERALRMWCGLCASVPLVGTMLDPLTTLVITMVLSEVTDVRTERLSNHAHKAAKSLYEGVANMVEDLEAGGLKVPDSVARYVHAIDSFWCAAQLVNTADQARSTYRAMTKSLDAHRQQYAMIQRTSLFTLLSGEVRLMKAQAKASQTESTEGGK